MSITLVICILPRNIHSSSNNKMITVCNIHCFNDILIIVMKKIKYPKIITLLLVYMVVFYLFSFSQELFEAILTHLSYFGVFLSGALYTYSFTASIGTASFLILNNFYNPLTIALLGGLGAALADVSILRFLEKYNLDSEFKQLSQEKIFKKIRFSFLRSRIFLTICGLLLIASPMPDELGILFISRGKIISIKHLFVVGLIANSIGIYVISMI